MVYIQGELQYLCALHHSTQGVIDLVSNPCGQPSYAGHLGRLQHQLLDAHAICHVINTQHGPLDIIGQQREDVHIAVNRPRFGGQMLLTSVRRLAFAQYLLEQIAITTQFGASPPKTVPASALLLYLSKLRPPGSRATSHQSIESKHQRETRDCTKVSFSALAKYAR